MFIKIDLCKISMKYLFVLIIFFECLICSATNRALIVGIGEYDTDKTGWEKLHGDKDLDLLSETLITVGFDKDNIYTLKNEQATKRGILAALKYLAEVTRPGDVLMFHFSGHGQPVKDLNGDETNGNDESIVPYDAFKTPKYKNGEKYYQGENHIIDDELFPIFNEIKKKVGKAGYFLVTIDACYSRGIEMDAFGNLTPEEQARVSGVRGTDHILKVDERSPLNKVEKPGGYSKIGRMTVISACREDEQNFEYKVPESKEEYGSLSYTLYKLLRKGKSFSDIEKYFEKKSYSSDKIFIQSQHPKIVVY